MPGTVSVEIDVSQTTAVRTRVLAIHVKVCATTLADVCVAHRIKGDSLERAILVVTHAAIQTLVRSNRCCIRGVYPLHRHDLMWNSKSGNWNTE